MDLKLQGAAEAISSRFSLEKEAWASSNTLASLCARPFCLVLAEIQDHTHGDDQAELLLRLQPDEAVHDGILHLGDGAENVANTAVATAGEHVEKEKAGQAQAQVVAKVRLLRPFDLTAWDIVELRLHPNKPIDAASVPPTLPVQGSGLALAEEEGGACTSLLSSTAVVSESLLTDYPLALARTSLRNRAILLPRSSSCVAEGKAGRAGVAAHAAAHAAAAAVRVGRLELPHYDGTPRVFDAFCLRTQQDTRFMGDRGDGSDTDTDKLCAEMRLGIVCDGVTHIIVVPPCRRPLLDSTLPPKCWSRDHVTNACTAPQPPVHPTTSTALAAPASRPSALRDISEAAQNHCVHQDEKKDASAAETSNTQCFAADALLSFEPELVTLVRNAMGLHCSHGRTFLRSLLVIGSGGRTLVEAVASIARARVICVSPAQLFEIDIGGSLEPKFCISSNQGDNFGQATAAGEDSGAHPRALGRQMPLPHLGIGARSSGAGRLLRYFELMKVLARGGGPSACDGSSTNSGVGGQRVRAVLVLENIDSILPAGGGRARAGAVGQEERELLLQFMAAMDRLQASDTAPCIVVGLTSGASAVHAAARSCFDLDLRVDPPSPSQRFHALHAFLVQRAQWAYRSTGSAAVLAQELLTALPNIAAECHGFSRHDLQAVARDAFTRARHQSHPSCTSAAAATVVVTEADVRGAVHNLTPAALRPGLLQDAARESGGGGDSGVADLHVGSVVRMPRARGTSSTSSGGDRGRGHDGGHGDISWQDVAGHAAAKRALQQLVVWPHTRAALLRRLGAPPVHGVLLHGPPGTGKTMLARATANEAGAHFVSISISELIRAELGESEQRLAAAFAMARRVAPCVLFFDEFQALFGERGGGGSADNGGSCGGGGVGDALTSQLLVEMDELWQGAGGADDGGGSGGDGGGNSDDDGNGNCNVNNVSGGNGADYSNRVMVLAATNAPDAVDPAFLRPNRFDRLVYVGALDADGRHELLQRASQRARWGEDVNVQRLANRTEGFTGAELAALCRCAAMHAVADGRDKVLLCDFDRQLAHIRTIASLGSG